MNLVYLLSEKFNYSLQICTGDAGPGYAASLGIQAITWVEYKKKGLTIDAIFDTRLLCDELNSIEELISSLPKTLFLMAVTDPYIDLQQGTPYMNLLFRLVSIPNVFILSKYQPEEITRDLMNRFGEKRFLVLNYVYEEEQAVILRADDKKINKIILSGSLNKNIYPERFAFKLWSARFPFRFFIDSLAHPGYPDVGQTLKHRVIHHNYIDYLSKYRFMFVSPSRCGLEFLKYREAAYAGVLPIGIPPKTFTDEMKAPMIKVDIKNPLPAFLKALLMSRSEYFYRVKEYRSAFMKCRSRDRQRLLLRDFLAKISLETTP